MTSFIIGLLINYFVSQGEDMLKLMPYLYNGNLHHLLNSVEIEAEEEMEHEQQNQQQQ